MPHYGPSPQPAATKLAIWMPLALAAMLSLGIWIGYALRTAGPMSHGGELLGGGTVEEVIRFIESRYVDSTSKERLTANAIQAILRELDPHSSFIPAKELQGVNEQLEGNFEGVGIRFNFLRDTILVLGVVPDGPSQKAGVLPGDKIIRINDTLVAGSRLKDEDVTTRLRGPAGSLVNVTVLRRGEGLKTFSIQRGEIPINSVDAAYMLDAQTGIIKINRFSGSTFEEFSRALEDLYEKHNLRNLVIDVRDNPGGYLNAATKILDQLFREKELLVYTKGRASARKDYNSTGHPLYAIDKVAVLIDENAASASEILAGAIQDHDRGVLVGRRTFGKGLVQEQYDLSDGSALRLTIARYYTPSNRCIQKAYVKGDLAYDHDIAQRYAHGELNNVDSIRIADSTEYRTDAGRVVFGGGGIVPDIFVPLDPMFKNDFFVQSSRKLTPWVYDYWESQRTRLAQKFPDVDAFMKGFVWEDASLNAFLASMKADGITGTPNAIAEAATGLRLRFKGELARLMFGEEAAHRIFDQQDNIVIEALRAIQDDAYRMRAMRMR